jgi:hypothetical protein
MPQQQQNNGWTPVEAPPDGWTPAGNTEANSATGITVPRGTVDQPDSAIGAFFRRGRDIAKSAYHTVADPPTDAENAESKEMGGSELGNRISLPIRRIAKGAYEGEKQAAGQAKEQFKSAQSIPPGNPVENVLAYSRAGVTAASMADPLATGPVTNINTLEKEGRSKEAIGAGAFDALSLLVGGRMGREVSPATKLNKLAYATGAREAGTIRPLAHLLPDFEATVAKVGKANTVGELENVIQTTMDGYEQKFNTGLAGTTGKLVPSDIADELESKARTMPPTAEGRQIANKLRKAAVEYRKPWTPQELNAERMYRNANTQAFHKASETGQMAAMRANADTMIDELVAEKSRDVLYDEMERQHPGQGFRELKQKQSSVLEMHGKFKKHVERLEAAQAARSGAPFSEKAGISASAHGGGVTPRAHVTELVKAGPLTHANNAVRSAFGPTTGALGRRAAVLSLPVSSITMSRPATVPAPPGGDENEGPQ